MTGGGGEWERPDAGAPSSDRRIARGANTSITTSGRGRLRSRSGRSSAVAALESGGDVFQRTARTMLVGSAALLAPLVAVNLWVTVVGFDRFDPDDTFFPSLGSSTASGVEDVAPFVGAVGVSIATAIVGWFVAGVALDDRFGLAPVGVGRRLAGTARRLPAILWLWIVGHWWQPLLVGLVVSAEQEDVGGMIFVMGALGWFAASATLFAVPAARTERLGAVAALRRSWRLFRRSSGSAFAFVAATTVLGGLYLVGLATIAPLLEANGFLAFGDSTWLVQGVLVQLGVIMVMPLVAACTAQFYVEVRAEREGLDLLLEADAVFGTDSGRDAIVDGAPS